MRYGEGIELFTSSVMEQYETKKSTLSHETKVQFRPLALYHIFHNTDTYTPFCLCKRGGIESKALKKKVCKRSWKRIFEKVMFGKKFC